TLDRGEPPRSTAFVRDPEALAHAEREVRIVVEEERSHVVVVDEEQHVRALVRKPLLHGLVALEDRCPDRILLLLGVEREADRGRVGGGDPSDYGGHGMTPERWCAVRVGEPARCRFSHNREIRQCVKSVWNDSITPRSIGTTVRPAG